MSLPWLGSFTLTDDLCERRATAPQLRADPAQRCRTKWGSSPLTVHLHEDSRGPGGFCDFIPEFYSSCIPCDTHTDILPAKSAQRKYLPRFIESGFQNFSYSFIFLRMVMNKLLRTLGSRAWELKA